MRSNGPQMSRDTGYYIGNRMNEPLTLVEKDGWDVCLDVMVQGTWKLAGGSRNVASLACLLLDFLSLRKSAQTWNTSPSL